MSNRFNIVQSLPLCNVAGTFFFIIDMSEEIACASLQKLKSRFSAALVANKAKHL